MVEGKYQPSADSQYRYLAALAADKQATATRLIAPSLPARLVIADRWLLSELAFFAVKHDRSPKETYSHLTEHLGVIPDLTLLLHLTRAREAPRTMAAAGQCSGGGFRTPLSLSGSTSRRQKPGRAPAR